MKFFAANLLCAACILTTYLVSCDPGHQQSGQRIEWSHIGLGGGGAMFIPTISPHDPDMVFVTCDMGGSFVTYDGGASWRMFTLSHQARFFVFDPVDPDVVYANSFALFKSEDKGLTWRLFYPELSEVAGKVSKGDHGAEVIVTKDSTRRTVQALAIDPTQSKHLYAAISIDQAVALYTSIDGGAKWTKEKAFDYDIKNIFIDPSSPAGQRTLYVASANGIDQRVDGQWQLYNVPAKNVLFNTVSGGYDADSQKFILYATSGRAFSNRQDNESGIFFSDNGGKTWENRQDGLLSYCAPGKRDAEFWGMAACAQHPGTLYVSYMKLAGQADTTFMGVAKSTDYGKTWTLPWKDGGGAYPPLVTPTVSNYSGCWLADRFGAGYIGVPFSPGVSPTDPDICYGTNYGCILKTADGGKTWDGSLHSTKLHDGSWTTRNIEVTGVNNIVFDPFDESHVLLCLTDVGLMESKNGGKSWKCATLNNGIPMDWECHTYWAVFDPEVKGRVWSVMSGTHDLPRPKMWRNSTITNWKGGVLLSNDSGATWQPVSIPTMGEGAVTHLLLDPTSKKKSRTLYACAFGKGVYKSTDGGMTWVQKNKGIEGAEPFAWQIERRESDGTLFLIMSRRSEDGSIDNDHDGALYQSTDGAETWTKMALPEGSNGPTDITTSKKYPKRLVLSTWGRATTGKFTPDIGGGIFISDDEGKTWEQVMGLSNDGILPSKMFPDQHIYAITFDPRNSRYYACGFNASAYYSEDGAESWTRIKGYNFKWGFRVTPDPRNPDMIFVLTFGGGLWYGPANGDPEATEDVLTYLERK